MRMRAGPPARVCCLSLDFAAVALIEWRRIDSICVSDLADLAATSAVDPAPQSISDPLSSSGIGQSVTQSVVHQNFSSHDRIRGQCTHTLQ